TDLLLHSDLSEDQRDYADTVSTCADSLLSLVNDILDLSKIDAGKLDIEVIDFDLRTTVENVVDMVAQQAHEKGLELACIVHPEVPSLLRGDPVRLRQILANLASNAVKFTEQGEVVIRATLDEETPACATVRFTVTDTGAGIAPDRIPHLFDSFNQGDVSTARRFGGTGLGLAISKQLVEMMNGKIGVESEPGNGSVFWFTAVVEKQREEHKTVPGPLADISGQRVLVVDDNVTNLEILCMHLTSWMVPCMVASNAARALEQLRDAVSAGEPFRVALVDRLMPGMDGEALGREIKEDEMLRDTALVMLTSIGCRGDAARIREIGFSGYLTKPIRQTALHDCLATVLGKPSGATEGKVDGALVTQHSLAEDRRLRTRILVAEDTAVNQKVISGLLERLGYQFDIVTNGRDAVWALEEYAYDLVLMDVEMPEMDGLEATRTIRDHASKVDNHEVPVIAMTGHALEGDRERCLEAGMNAYIAKPIRPKELGEAIEKHLPSRRKETRS
ncbi:response regulator, partial [Candidatus Eisenbacteria bacterium]